MAHSATDDSALKVYALDGSKLVGMKPEPIFGGDTMFSNLSSGVINIGAGLQLYNAGNQIAGVGYSNFFPTAITGSGEDNTFALGRYTSGEVALICDDPFRFNFKNLLTYLTGYTVSYAQTAYPIHSYPWNYTANTIYLQLYKYNKLVKLTVPTGRYFDAAQDLALITLPSTSYGTVQPVSSAVFQNRMFMVDTYGYLIYSAAGNYENWTASATEGGIIKVSTKMAYSLQATDSMLYVLTQEGVYALYGDYDPSTWTLNKVSNVKIDQLNFASVKTSNNDVYFISADGVLYKLSSGVCTKVANLPSSLSPSSSTIVTYNGTVIGERFIAFHINIGTFAYLPNTLLMYDTVSNCWSYVYGVSAVDEIGIARNANAIKDNFHYEPTAHTMGTGLLYDLSIPPINDTNTLIDDVPATVVTEWTTLDGSSATKKHIRRVEFDILWEPRPNATTSYLYYTPLDTFQAYGEIYQPYYNNYAVFQKYLKVEVQADLWNKKLTKTFTNLSALGFTEDVRPQYYPNVHNQLPTVRTFTLNNYGGINTAISSVRFNIEAYGKFCLKQIRVYYEDAGSYKNQGKY